MTEYDAIVVGGGPAGSTAAKIIAEAGFRVLIIERAGPGRNKACAGGISIRAFEKLNLDYKDFVEREIFGARICSPDNSIIEHDYRRTVGITVYREKFDSYLLRSAMNTGCDVLTNAMARDFSRTNASAEVLFEKNNTTERISGKIIIAADGAFSNISRKAGLNGYDKNDVGVCAQYEMEMKEEDINALIGNKIELYFGDSIAPGGYGWIFPKKRGVTVGVGIPLPDKKKKMSEYLETFVEKHPIASQKLKNAKIIGRTGGSVPIKGVRGNTYSDNLLVVGDAAGQVSPLTAEGIYYSMISAKIAARTAMDAISENDFSKKYLEKYEHEWKKEIGADLKWGILINKLMLSEDRKINYLVHEAGYDRNLKIMIADFIMGAAPYDEILWNYYKTVLPFFFKGFVKGIYF
ncbi:MAG TPA: NAD(P)/FAD-dependent oxidoreductase [Candidatus Methanoperedens sp.]